MSGQLPENFEWTALAEQCERLAEAFGWRDTDATVLGHLLGNVLAEIPANVLLAAAENSPDGGPK